MMDCVEYWDAILAPETKKQRKCKHEWSYASYSGDGLAFSRCAKCGAVTIGEDK